MGSSELGHEILDTLWEFGRPCLIAGIACVMWASTIGRQKIRANLATAGIVVSIPGLMAMFYFLNIEGTNLLHLSQMRPMWGAYVAVFLLATIAIALRLAVLAFQENGKIDDLHLYSPNTEAEVVETRARIPLVVGAVWLTLFAGTVVWLWLIAKGN